MLVSTYRRLHAKQHSLRLRPLPTLPPLHRSLPSLGCALPGIFSARFRISKHNENTRCQRSKGGTERDPRAHLPRVLDYATTTTPPARALPGLRVPAVPAFAGVVGGGGLREPWAERGGGLPWGGADGPVV